MITPESYCSEYCGKKDKYNTVLANGGLKHAVLLTEFKERVFQFNCLLMVFVMYKIIYLQLNPVNIFVNRKALITIIIKVGGF